MCKYSCYGVPCKTPFVNEEGFCETHAGEQCWCGKQAVEGCSMELQFVCGRPLCEEHADRCPAHGGEKPKTTCSECGQTLPAKGK